MQLIQIPLEPPSPPQPRPGHHPDQGDLFDTNSWESAYRELHDFPTLLIQTRDELARSRKREAFWISLIAHIVLVLLIINFPSLEKYLPHRAVMMVHTGRDNDKLTFLELPPDAQKVRPPKTNIMSDKSRIAQSRAPKLNRDELKKILDASRQGRPGMAAPAPQQAPAPQPAPPQVAQAEPQQAAQPQPPPPANQMAKLQTPPMERKPPVPSFNTGPMSASRSIAEAAQKAAANHGRFAGDNGDLGLGQRQNTARMGDIDITSDTMGVDFGPYLQRVLHDVKQNWYAVIPESAMPPLLKKGKLSIEFAIGKNGQIEGIRYVSSSGDVALDRAAYGGITASNPFPPLPAEFVQAARRENREAALGLKFTFLYNPDPNEADLH